MQEENSVDVRQMACLIFRNFIINKAQVQEYVDFWVKLNEDVRQKIRTDLMSSMISNQKMVRNAVANLISAIASIDLPNNNWQDLIPILC